MTSHIPWQLDAGIGPGGRRRRLAAWWQRQWIRGTTMRPRSIPYTMRVALRRSGFSRADIARIMRTMRSLHDWDDAFELEGITAMQRRDWKRAGAALQFAQLTVQPGSSRSRELTERAEKSYLSRQDVIGWSTAVEYGDAHIRCLVQEPEGEPRGLVLIMGGFGVAKERFHRHSAAALKAGYSVLRMDMPDRWAGIPLEDSIRTVLRELKPRIPDNQIHLFGTCLGASFLVEFASQYRVASLTTVGAIIDPVSCVDYIPIDSLRVLGELPDEPTRDDLVAVADRYNIVERAQLITSPSLLFHGALDRVASARQMTALAAAIGDSAQTQIYLLQGHACLGKVAEITDRWIAFIDDLTPPVSGTRVGRRAA